MSGHSKWRDIPTVKKLRWADERGLTRSKRPRCGHGLRRRNECPDLVCLNSSMTPLLDHPTLWKRDGQPAVLISHVYEDDALTHELALMYALEHTLQITIGDPADGWYGEGTTPVRMEPADSASVLVWS